MFKNIDIKNTAILIDFDGTISVEDTNDKLIEYFWNDEIEKYLKYNNEEEMNYIDFMDGLFSKLKINEEEYLNFILNEINLTKGFIDFYKNIKLYNIEIAIISGGFDNGIVPFLNKYKINDIKIYANSLEFHRERIIINYYHNREKNCCEIGSCGNCKRKHIEAYRKNKENIIFIGDGITDRPVAEKSDIILAKDGLLNYCKKKNIDCISWDNFEDINNILF